MVDKINIKEQHLSLARCYTSYLKSSFERKIRKPAVNIISTEILQLHSFGHAVKSIYSLCCITPW